MEEKTARELAEIVAGRLNISDTLISVHPSEVLGWTATVVARPLVIILAQSIVDEIVIELRAKYSLKRD